MQLLVDTSLGYIADTRVLNLGGEDCEFGVPPTSKPALKIGSDVTLHFWSEPDLMVSRRATITALHSAEESLVYRARIAQSAKQSAEFSEVAQTGGERRLSLRVEADPARPAWTRIEGIDRPLHVLGAVRDISFSGAAVVCAPHEAVHLEGVDVALVYLDLPGSASPAVFEARIVGLQAGPRSLVCRLHFRRAVRTGGDSSALALVDYILARQRQQPQPT